MNAAAAPATVADPDLAAPADFAALARYAIIAKLIPPRTDTVAVSPSEAASEAGAAPAAAPKWAGRSDMVSA